MDPIVRSLQSIVDDSISEQEHRVFIERSVAMLGRALKSPKTSPEWAGEFHLALDNLKAASFAIDIPSWIEGEPSLELPDAQAAHTWLQEHGPDGVLLQGRVERFTAFNLLVLLDRQDDETNSIVIKSLGRLLRHVEIRRKASISLRESGSSPERWCEVDDTAILFARAAREMADPRYLNAGMKLIDWAHPVHRRSVPVELLVRYVLAVSEVQRAFRELV